MKRTERGKGQVSETDFLHLPYWFFGVFLEFVEWCKRISTFWFPVPGSYDNFDGKQFYSMTSTGPISSSSVSL